MPDVNLSSALLHNRAKGRTGEHAATPATPALLTALRDGTRAAHAQLEATPGMVRLLSTDLTHKDYVSILAALRDFHVGIRRAVLPFAAQLAPFDASGGAVLEALYTDLAWFGRTAAVQPTDVVALPDAVSALGALYVLEGSTLGGRVIGRAISKSLGVSSMYGGHFFCGVTAEAARTRWLDFTALLARASAWPEGGMSARVVEAALAAFACFERLVVPASAEPHFLRSGTPQASRPYAATASPGVAAPAYS